MVSGRHGLGRITILVFDTPVLGELAPQRRTEDLNWQRRPWAGRGSLSTGSPAGRLMVTGTRKLLCEGSMYSQATVK